MHGTAPGVVLFHNLRMLLRLSLLLCALFAGAAALAQDAEPPNGLLLVAKPGLGDPRFRETVVLVTQTPDSETVGVILNRPTQAKLSDIISDGALARSYSDTVFYGGPVMPRTIVALFRSGAVPGAPAFQVLKGLYLGMHPALIEPLLTGAGSRYRLYAGFSGWAPRQLESEMQGGSWYVLPATEELVFRKDTSGMWQELVEKALGKHVRGDILDS
jgi:putative transcriptional regulator